MKVTGKTKTQKKSFPKISPVYLYQGKKIKGLTRGGLEHKGIHKQNETKKGSEGDNPHHDIAG